MISDSVFSIVSTVTVVILSLALSKIKIGYSAPIKSIQKPKKALLLRTLKMLSVYVAITYAFGVITSLYMRNGLIQSEIVFHENVLSRSQVNCALEKNEIKLKMCERKKSALADVVHSEKYIQYQAQLFEMKRDPFSLSHDSLVTFYLTRLATVRADSDAPLDPRNDKIVEDMNKVSVAILNESIRLSSLLKASLQAIIIYILAVGIVIAASLFRALASKRSSSFFSTAKERAFSYYLSLPHFIIVLVAASFIL